MNDGFNKLWNGFIDNIKKQPKNESRNDRTISFQQQEQDGQSHLSHTTSLPLTPQTPLLLSDGKMQLFRDYLFTEVMNHLEVIKTIMTLGDDDACLLIPILESLDSARMLEFDDFGNNPNVILCKDMPFYPDDNDQDDDFDEDDGHHDDEDEDEDEDDELWGGGRRRKDGFSPSSTRGVQDTFGRRKSAGFLLECHSLFREFDWRGHRYNVFHFAYLNPLHLDLLIQAIACACSQLSLFVVLMVHNIHTYITEETPFYLDRTADVWFVAAISSLYFLKSMQVEMTTSREFYAGVQGSMSVVRKKKRRVNRDGTQMSSESIGIEREEEEGWFEWRKRQRATFWRLLVAGPSFDKPFIFMGKRYYWEKKYDDMVKSYLVHIRFFIWMVDFLANTCLATAMVVFNCFFVVLVSDNVNDAILNSLALAFILELDDIIDPTTSNLEEDDVKDAVARRALVSLIRKPLPNLKELHVVRECGKKKSTNEDNGDFVFRDEDKVYVWASKDNNESKIMASKRLSPSVYSETVTFTVQGTLKDRYFEIMKNFESCSSYRDFQKTLQAYGDRMKPWLRSNRKQRRMTRRQRSLVALPNQMIRSRVGGTKDKEYGSLSYFDSQDGSVKASVYGSTC